MRGRDAWDPKAPWRDLARWGRGTDEPEKGESEVTVERPTLLMLRTRAPKFPRSGISRIRADYVGELSDSLRWQVGWLPGWATHLILAQDFRRLDRLLTRRASAVGRWEAKSQ